MHTDVDTHSRTHAYYHTNTRTHTHGKHSRVRNINSTINLKAEYWTLRSTSSISGKSEEYTHIHTRHPESCSSDAHSTPLSILFLLSSPFPSISTTVLFHPSLPRLLTFTSLLWSIPLSSLPPASWMLKQEIKGWRSTLSGNQKCLGAFQPCATGQADAQQTRAGERAAQNNRFAQKGPNIYCRCKSDLHLSDFQKARVSDWFSAN